MASIFSSVLFVLFIYLFIYFACDIYLHNQYELRDKDKGIY